MQGVKIIHTADLHIGSPMTELKDRAQMRQAELLDTFGKIIDITKEESADDLIISGGLFDNAQPVKTSIKLCMPQT